ncbi:PHB depolymerase family esterase [Paracoccus sp. MC1862]|uniref:extracellular catalytic domain type 1 short-chain-length polyhydroxyalkanoate depolymerase n=1 Tax=Paracoccus sp. MC1862 TaxID=2760307 RepID=UPI00160139BB|nr:PHB depolymerase family esterase [Paracoccus sp. MC1862]MBB1499087.1 PHB depolymerase family esterase [Paracoccus sp. MC1862]QQO46600.1 PHB depolymerase family esterase [Paracoccus sp. MC1862]
MNTNDYVAEILRATGTLRSGDPAGVTAIVQNALSLAGLSGAGGGIPAGNPTPAGQAPEIVLPRENYSEIFPARTERLRKPLGEVIRSLQEGGKGLKLDGLPGLGRPLQAPELPLPEGARFLDERYSCPAGARRYRLYVPSTADEGLQGLIVMLHGCTQSPEDFAAGTGMNTLAEEHRLLVVYPAQTGGDNSMSCWNWFRPGDQMRDSGEPAIIAGLTESLRDQYAIPADRVFVAGLSAGGAMAAIMGETYPELYGAIGVHSGLAYGSANDAMSAFAVMRGQAGIAPAASGKPHGGSEAEPRLIVFHGSADTTVHPSNAERIIAGKGGSGGKTSRSEPGAAGETRGYTRLVTKRKDGTHGVESWMIDGAQHAWSGGHPSGSYTDPRGPDASAAMVRFFLDGASDLPGA